MNHQLSTGRLRSLECFHAIMTNGSATAAARRLGLTQPAVSRLIAALERQLGFALFDRVKGRLIPTDDARALHGEVDVALQNVHRVSQLAQSIRDMNFGAITIVSPPSFAEGVLPRVISGFITKHPAVSVMLDSQDVAIACDKVALRAADCGFVRLPVERPGLDYRSLLRVGTVCAIPSAHRLTRKKVVSVADLHGEPLIMLGRGRAVRDQIDSIFKDAGVRMNVRIETRTVGAACAFARNGVGITIVNEMLAQQYAGEALALRRFSPEIIHEYAVITPTGAPISRITRAFLDFCQAHFEKNRDSFAPLSATRMRMRRSQASARLKP